MRSGGGQLVIGVGYNIISNIFQKQVNVNNNVFNKHSLTFVVEFLCDSLRYYFSTLFLLVDLFLIYLQFDFTVFLFHCIAVNGAMSPKNHKKNVTTRMQLLVSCRAIR